ncbi:NOL1/NOP2/sun family putative RNA methylase [Candidatus Woesearchaeota archaeon]|nr:NOL1/NOP2/sun family putative RNA methylase [Candidatus Woesearchaeota archaeon]
MPWELKRWENSDDIEFKPAFIERYSALTDFDKFKEYSLSFLRKSIRINTLKKPVSEIRDRLISKGWELEQIPWCKEGFWIRGERRDVGNLSEHILGYFYVQEAASMIPPIVLQPEPGELVLDMAAAPGSKTTQIAAMMQNRGLLIANEVDGLRIKALGINLMRSGVLNAVITKMDGLNFANKDIRFDRILLDAPCSATGTIRKSLKTISMWNPQSLKRLPALQKKLIQTAFNSLRPGGTLVYSTCTLEPEEDEGVIDHLLRDNPDARIMPIELDIERSDPVIEFEGRAYSDEVKKCLRIWPQDNDTEGFFVAKIMKN